MLKTLPRLSEQFHLSPADFWSLTQDEFDAYMSAAQDTDRANEEAGQRYG